MAEIRTERKKQNTWVWILLAVVLIAVVVAALVWLGYVELPGGTVVGNAATHAYLMRSI